MNRLLMTIMLALSTLGCAPNIDNSSPCSADFKSGAEIRNLQEQWRTALLNKDTAALSEFFAKNGVWVIHVTGKSVVGKQNIKAAMSEQLSKSWTPDTSVSITLDELVISGDYAFARGIEDVSYPGTRGTIGAPNPWMATYQKQPDGSWKYYWTMLDIQ